MSEKKKQLNTHNHPDRATANVPTKISFETKPRPEHWLEEGATMEELTDSVENSFMVLRGFLKRQNTKNLASTYITSTDQADQTNGNDVDSQLNTGASSALEIEKPTSLDQPSLIEPNSAIAVKPLEDQGSALTDIEPIETIEIDQPTDQIELDQVSPPELSFPLLSDLEQEIEINEPTDWEESDQVSAAELSLPPLSDLDIEVETLSQANEPGLHAWLLDALPDDDAIEQAPLTAFEDVIEKTSSLPPSEIDPIEETVTEEQPPIQTPTTDSMIDSTKEMPSKFDTAEFDLEELVQQMQALRGIVDEVNNVQPTSTLDEEDHNTLAPSSPDSAFVEYEVPAQRLEEHDEQEVEIPSNLFVDRDWLNPVAADQEDAHDAHLSISTSQTPSDTDMWDTTVATGNNETSAPELVGNDDDLLPQDAPPLDLFAEAKWATDLENNQSVELNREINTSLFLDDQPIHEAFDQDEPAEQDVVVPETDLQTNAPALDNIDPEIDISQLLKERDWLIGSDDQLDETSVVDTTTDTVTDLDLASDISDIVIPPQPDSDDFSEDPEHDQADSYKLDTENLAKFFVDRKWLADIDDDTDSELHEGANIPQPVKPDNMESASLPETTPVEDLVLQDEGDIFDDFAHIDGVEVLDEAPLLGEPDVADESDTLPDFMTQRDWLSGAGADLPDSNAHTSFVEDGDVEDFELLSSDPLDWSNENDTPPLDSNGFDSTTNLLGQRNWLREVDLDIDFIEDSTPSTQGVTNTADLPLEIDNHTLNGDDFSRELAEDLETSQATDTISGRDWLLDIDMDLVETAPNAQPDTTWLTPANLETDDPIQEEDQALSNEFLDWVEDKLGIEEGLEPTETDYPNDFLTPAEFVAPNLNELINIIDQEMRQAYGDEDLTPEGALPVIETISIDDIVVTPEILQEPQELLDEAPQVNASETGELLDNLVVEVSTPEFVFEEEDASETETVEEIQLNQYLVFELNKVHYAAPATNIREVSEIDKITSVPNVPHWIEGITNLRGDILSLVDLRAFFELPRTLYNPERQILVAHSDAGFSPITTGLVVDMVYEIQYFADEEIQPSTDDIPQQVVPYLQGIYPLHPDKLLLLDLDRLLNSPKMRQFDP
ncbi:MAG: chemotaxis protein CheW [Chloroflexota bacterium]